MTVKQLERSKKSLEAKLAKLNDQSRKDDVVTFEELGVDRLFVDEAHFYKNLAAYSKMRNVAGITQTEAQKSSDLYMKCRYLDELTGGKGCVFATGTPISNTMVELYTMQKAQLVGLCYKDTVGKWTDPHTMFWGFPGMLVREGDTLYNRLACIEKNFMALEELQADYENYLKEPNVDFEKFCDDIFGDG